MNNTINARFLKEAKNLEERWNKNGVPDELLKNWDRRSCAVLLESQRLVNEMPGPCVRIGCRSALLTV